eukprot:m.896419 g.896419  ORF g.896419 m.896419 type:complete len:70 (+) comp23666_c0_seq36:1021-1230(+)
MILVLDNGWGSGFTLNTTRFPMFAGASNENSLAKLSNYVKSFGWRGGHIVCAASHVVNLSTLHYTASAV